MEKEVKTELDALMKKVEKRKEDAIKNQDKDKIERKVFLERFEQIKKDIIRPVMEDMGNYLKENGHDYKISSNEESVDHKGAAIYSSIDMKIYLSGIKKEGFKSENTPYISFHTYYDKNIHLNESNMTPSHGGSAGPHGDYKPELITKKLVESEIVALLKEIFDSKF